MRLWHKELIKVLPRQQLISQWRECCCIARNINVKGSPNHILVNPIMNYPINDFMYYTFLVYCEIINRGYRANFDKFRKHFPLYCPNGFYVFANLYEDWHNDRYLIQCFYNLQEKFDRGGISVNEWNKIESFCKERLGYEM